MQMRKADHLHQEAPLRTTLDIDDAALAGAMETAPGLTKTAVINEALREFARRRRVRRLVELRGKVRWEGRLDALRGRERGGR
jgi:Arc/MetJ family transcription regulator